MAGGLHRAGKRVAPLTGYWHGDADREGRRLTEQRAYREDYFVTVEQAREERDNGYEPPLPPHARCGSPSHSWLCISSSREAVRSNIFAFSPRR